jgi:hypothetical protein
MADNQDKVADLGASALSTKSKEAIKKAADVIHADHPLAAGHTALFWDLVGTAANHVKTAADAKTTTTTKP